LWSKNAVARLTTLTSRRIRPELAGRIVAVAIVFMAWERIGT